MRRTVTAATAVCVCARVFAHACSRMRVCMHAHVCVRVCMRDLFAIYTITYLTKADNNN